MTSLIQCHKISKTLGLKSLFEELSLSLSSKDKLGLTGPNGAGKSTLLKLLTKELNPDKGHVTHCQSLKFSLLSQDFCFQASTPFQQLENGRLAQYQIEEALSKVGFRDYHQRIEAMSGGWKKRLQLAMALAENPDFLILDEPTNHLDLQSLLWLENYLKPLSYILVSHDRLFLERCCTKILEINPLYPKGHFFAIGSYESFLEKKNRALHDLQKEEAALAAQSKREVKFLQSNPKARSTKSNARIKQAGELLDKLQQMRGRRKQASFELQLQNNSKKAKQLIKLCQVSKGFNACSLFEIEDLKIVEGMKLGVLGPNGCGKSTFIRCLMGDEPLDKGSIKRHDHLQLSYLSQLRKEINEEQSLSEALASQGDFATYQGKKIHVRQLAQNLGFEEHKLIQKVKGLSGGEKARLHLARALAHPCDLLILDEPTNDLDINTMEKLEEMLGQFKGAIILITHDRYFLDTLCDTLMTFSQGKVHFFASYQQYESFFLEEKKRHAPAKERKAKPKQLLSSSERKELKTLPSLIQKTEKKLEDFKEKLLEASKKGNFEKSREIAEEVEIYEGQLDKYFTRWQDLEDKKRAL